MVLFSGEGWLFFLRWFHFLSGIAWIGMLYYFNFVQTPFFASAEAPVRIGMITGGLVERALWWFRWGAMFTFITGWLMILHKMGQLGLNGFFNTSYGWAIFFGGMLGSLMWFNVWFVIWPAQQVVIANATKVAAGGEADPAAPARAARAGLASRTNTLFSIPMVFFMVSAQSFPTLGTNTNVALYWIFALIVVLAIELNALVGTGQARQKPLSTVSGTIHAGIALTFILFALMVMI
jgi:uncharacterized membrane protein